MCGISGFFAPQGLFNAGELLQQMNNALAHRGPNDAGYWLGHAHHGTSYADAASHPDMLSHMPMLPLDTQAKVGLAHRRLSIIDLSSLGHQPMLLDDRYVLSFNGEIYNYLELRQQLQAQGIAFKTASDVEVLLQVWANHGIRGLDMLEGMWAFAIYDRQSDEFFLVRDRVGVKPLYYVHHQEVLYFASEPKALLAAGVCSHKLNEAAVYAFLMHASYEEGEGSLLADLREIAPGHLLRINSQGLSQSHQWYQPAVSDSWSTLPTPASLLEEINHTLQRSVQLRLRSDVPVGASLSGGLDSSVLSMLAAQEKGFPLFTASYQNFEGDESKYACQLAEQLGAKWQQVGLNSAHVENQLDSLVATMDGPLLAFSTFSQHEIYRAAKAAGITILLDGQGGDELFSGYHRYWYNYHQQAWQDGQWKWFGKHPSSGLSWRDIQPTLLHFTGTGILSSAWARPLLQSQLKRSKLEYSLLQRDFIDQHLHVSAKRFSTPTLGLNAQLATERYGHALKNLLRWGDRNSMVFGMENRAPLADDPQLDKLLLQLPANWKMHPKKGSKLLLKQAMENQLPKAILNRTDKIGFSAPTIAWMNALWPHWKSNLIYLEPWVNLKAINAASTQLLATEWGCLALLRMVSLGAWIKRMK